MRKPLPRLMAGAQAFLDMLAGIQAQAAIKPVPASESDADVQAAYAGVYAATDQAVSEALDKHAGSVGFRRALGHYLYTLATGAVPTDAGRLDARYMITDGEGRAMPEADEEPDDGAGTPEEREWVAAQASYEIESIAMTLEELDDTESSWLLMRGLFLRISALNSVVMSVTGGDDTRQIAEMRAVVFGARKTAWEGASHG